MRITSRLLALVVVGSLLGLPLLGAQDKDKKNDAKKDDAKKTDVKKEDTPKKSDAKKVDAPKKSDAKKTAPAKKPVMPRYTPKKISDKDSAEKQVKAGVVVGQIVSLVADKKTIRLKVVWKIPQITADALNAIANAQNQVAQANSPQALVQATQNLAKAKAEAVTYADVPKEYELSAADNMRVRNANPPPNFDSKGRPKRYTNKELRELRGTEKLPGFPADFGDLKAEQTVKVTLMKKKGSTRARAKKNKDAVPDLLESNLPKMSLIVILSDPKK